MFHLTVTTQAAFGKILSVFIVPEMLEIYAEAGQLLRSVTKTAGEKSVI